MNWLEMRNERDEQGLLTDLALACDALADNGCDCGEDEKGTCLSCLCESALKGQKETIKKLRAEVTELRLLADDTLEQISILGRQSEKLRAEVAELKKQITLEKLTCSACIYTGKTVANDLRLVIEHLYVLKNEVNCRVEHGADGAAHLTYVENAIGKIISITEGE